MGLLCKGRLPGVFSESFSSPKELLACNALGMLTGFLKLAFLLVIIMQRGSVTIKFLLFV